MSPDTARLVHLLILAAGVVTWLLAVRAHRRAFARPLGQRPDELATGEVEVAATIPEVREKTVAGLRGAGLAGVGPVSITEAGDDRIAGEVQHLSHRKGPIRVNMAFEVTLAPQGGGTRATYRLTGSGSRGLRRASALFVCLLGPAALAGAAVLMHLVVIPHQDPEVRTQVVQTVQAVHFLWPPFLFAAVSRRLTRAVEQAFRALLANAAF